MKTIKKGWLTINSLREPAWWTSIEINSTQTVDFPIIYNTKEEAEAENTDGTEEYNRQIEAGERDSDDPWENDEIVEAWVLSTHEHKLWPLHLHEYGVGDIYTKEFGHWTFSQLQAMR